MAEHIKHPVNVITRTLGYLRHWYLAAPDRASQAVARTHAAQAGAVLRERRIDQEEDVDAYLRSTPSQDS